MHRRVCLALALGLLLAPTAAAAAGATAPVVSTVTTGAARSLGEPAAVSTARVAVVAATTFLDGRAVVHAWTRPAGAASWTDAGAVLPTGFADSYDPAAAALPDGAALVVVGAGSLAGGCISGSSVALARISARGELEGISLVSDQRGTGYFDDRPIVAAGAAGAVWVGWSRGVNSTSCEPVGSLDTPFLAASSDGGRSFAAPVDLAPGARAAFGLRLAPLPGGGVAAGWAQAAGSGQTDFLVERVGGTGAQLVLSGATPPLVLPGASFYDFPVGDLTALPDGRLAAVLPVWNGAFSSLALAVGRPGGAWLQASLTPAPGSDLLLPALAAVSNHQLRLLAAVHAAVGDELDYSSALVAVSGSGLAPGSLQAVTPALAGPGFFEIGEELSLQRARGKLVGSVVSAGRAGAALQLLSWAVPETPSPVPSGAKPSVRPVVSSSTRASRVTAHGGSGWTDVLVAVGVIALLGIGLRAAFRSHARR